MVQDNIYPVATLPREKREELLGQHAVMIWFTGLSGSGKSTVALALERELHRMGRICRVLDGDNIRSGINNNLGFSTEDRMENIRRIAEVAKLFVDTGIITVAAFISPTCGPRHHRRRGLFRGLCQHAYRGVRGARRKRSVQKGACRPYQGVHGCQLGFRAAAQSVSCDRHVAYEPRRVGRCHHAGYMRQDREIGRHQGEAGWSLTVDAMCETDVLAGR